MLTASLAVAHESLRARPPARAACRQCTHVPHKCGPPHRLTETRSTCSSRSKMPGSAVDLTSVPPSAVLPHARTGAGTVSTGAPRDRCAAGSLARCCSPAAREGARASRSRTSSALARSLGGVGQPLQVLAQRGNTILGARQQATNKALPGGRDQARGPAARRPTPARRRGQQQATNKALSGSRDAARGPAARRPTPARRRGRRERAG